MFDFQPLPPTTESLDETSSFIDDFVFDYPPEYYSSSPKQAKVYETDRSAYLK